MIVCICKGVTTDMINELLQSGASNFTEVSRHCQAGQDCGSCASKIQKMVEDMRGGLKPLKNSSNNHSLT